MDTFITLFFLVGTCFVWIPVSIFWGLLKSCGFLIGGIFRSFAQPATEAFSTALIDCLRALVTVFIEGFKVIQNIWDWSGQNTTESILLGALGLFLIFGTVKYGEIIANIIFGLFIGAFALGGFEILIAVLYIAASAIVALTVNGFLYLLVYWIIAIVVFFKILAFLSDLRADRILNRDIRFKAKTLSRSKRLFFNFSETTLIIFIAPIFVFLFLSGLFVALAMLANFLFGINLIS